MKPRCGLVALTWLMSVELLNLLHVTCYIMFNVCGYKLLSVVEHPMLTCKIANVEICI